MSLENVTVSISNENIIPPPQFTAEGQQFIDSAETDT